MQWFRFNTSSVGFLVSSLLLGIILIYLLFIKRKTLDIWYLIGYLCVIFLLVLSYTISYSFFDNIAFITDQVSNLFILGVLFLIQFAYHYKQNVYKTESKLVFFLFLSAGIIIWIIRFYKLEATTVYDFQVEYFTFKTGLEISIVTLLGYILSFFVFIRKTIYFSKTDKDTNFFLLLFKPKGYFALSARSFALLTLLTSVLALLYLLLNLKLISRFTYSNLFNLSALVICFFIFITYLNNTSQSNSYLTKTVGIPLATILVSLGIVSISLTPVFKDTVYRQYNSKADLALQLYNTGTTSLLYSEIAFVIPAEDAENNVTYFNPVIDSALINKIYKKMGSPKAQYKENDISFFYIDLYDTQSFYFFIPQIYKDQKYYVGFFYSDYRLAIHNFVLRIVIVLMITTGLTLVLYPLIFYSNLIKPLKRILYGIRKVEAGNYKITMQYYSTDEIGQLADGYNNMVIALKNAENEQKKYQRKLQFQQQQILKADKLASLGALVASVAHEIKNPNQIITLHTNFLLEGITNLLKLAESPEQVDDTIKFAGLKYDDFKNELFDTISQIKKSTQRINYIVGNLKQYVRGRIDDVKTQTDVNELIHSVVNISHHFISKATNNFKFDLTDNLPKIKANKIQLEQVVLNLIQNACQALTSLEEGIVVSSSYHKDTHSVIIIIEDQGIGMSESVIDSVTKPFFTTKQDIGGTGLGLYVSNTIIKEHGGTLSFESGKNKGTIVTINLPVI